MSVRILSAVDPRCIPCSPGTFCPCRLPPGCALKDFFNYTDCPYKEIVAAYGGGGIIFSQALIQQMFSQPDFYWSLLAKRVTPGTPAGGTQRPGALCMGPGVGVHMRLMLICVALLPVPSHNGSSHRKCLMCRLHHCRPFPDLVLGEAPRQLGVGYTRLFNHDAQKMPPAGPPPPPVHDTRTGDRLFGTWSQFNVSFVASVWTAGGRDNTKRPSLILAH